MIKFTVLSRKREIYDKIQNKTDKAQQSWQ